MLFITFTKNINNNSTVVLPYHTRSRVKHYIVRLIRVYHRVLQSGHNLLRLFILLSLYIE